MVALLVKQGAETKGFRRAVERAFEDIRDGDVRWERVVPDAFEIDEQSGVVTIHEVVVTSRLTDAKFEAYGRLWCDFDWSSVDLRLLIHSPACPDRPEPVSLARVYRIMLENEARHLDEHKRRVFLFANSPASWPDNAWHLEEVNDPRRLISPGDTCQSYAPSTEEAVRFMASLDLQPEELAVLQSAAEEPNHG